MKIQTSELSGEALDWAVADCLGQVIFTDGAGWYRYGESAELWWPSTQWNLGGAMFETYCDSYYREKDGTCYATVGLSQCAGDTTLEAFLRALVTERSGKEVEVPDELVKVSENEQ